MKLKTLFTISLMITATAIQAQIIHVPSDQPTIQAGIDAATDGDTVLVAEDTYFENINFLGKAITVASEFIIDGNANHIDNTIIDGSQPANPDFGSAVSLVMGEDTTSVIMGFTITGGSGTLNQEINELVGGGIYLINSGAKISHNKITNNHINGIGITAGGAGIFCEAIQTAHFILIENNEISYNSTTSNSAGAYSGGIYSSSDCLIKNNMIEYNHCINTANGVAHGGGMTIFPFSAPGLDATIENNTIRHNSLQSFEGDGAGIFTIMVTNLTVSGNDISHNDITCPDSGFGTGGGILVFTSSESVLIENNEITGNQIVSGDWARGGGIALWEGAAKVDIIHNNIQDNVIEGMNNRGPGIWFRFPSGNVSVVDNSIRGNTGPVEGAQSGAGGGLCIMDATGAVNIDKNIFTGNEIYNGGGLYFRKSYNTVVTNNVFDGNKSNYGGGMTYYDPTQKSDGGALAADPWPLVANNVLINNEANSWGGGIFLQSYEVLPVIFNCIIRDNTASGGNDIYSLTGAEFLLDHCNVNTAAITGNWMGGNNINMEPVFLDDSCHLSPSCVCVEAGTVAVDYNGITYTCPDHDIDGEMRPMNTTADIGVDEVLLTGMLHDHAQNDPGTLKARPNPFTGSIAFIFELDQAGRANLVVYDPAGRPVRTVASPPLPAGKHEMVVDAAGLTEGVYTAMLITDGGIKTCKIIKVR